MDDKGSKKRQEIFSRVVRAGKRTYFFDVKQTRKGDLYLTMTESKKIFDKDGSFHFQKHKIFLYKEDFEKFADAYKETVEFIENNVEKSLEEGGLEKQDVKTDSKKSEDSGKEGEDKQKESESNENNNDENSEFTDVNFEDLDEKEKE